MRFGIGESEETLGGAEGRGRRNTRSTIERRIYEWAAKGRGIEFDGSSSAVVWFGRMERRETKRIGQDNCVNYPSISNRVISTMTRFKIVPRSSFTQPERFLFLLLRLFLFCFEKTISTCPRAERRVIV